MQSFLLKSTPFGPVALIWDIVDDRPRIARVLLSRPGLSAHTRLHEQFSHARPGTCAEIAALADGMNAFLAGEPRAFPLACADLTACSAFKRAVLRAEHSVPRGQVITYRQLAARAGNPNGARAVGTALATNPVPLLIPCHRAIRSDGRLGGFQGGLAMKRALLEYEGIALDEAGRAL